MPTLAVVMAIFNGEQFLRPQLDSIGRQTRKPDLLIISDDGSEDGSREVAERYKRSAPFETVVVDGPHRGLAENFWHAAQLTRANLVAWAD